jgi:hypothetical protein
MSISKERIAEIDNITTQLCTILKCKPDDILKAFMKLKKEHDALIEQYLKLKEHEF